MLQNSYSFHYSLVSLSSQYLIFVSWGMYQDTLIINILFDYKMFLRYMTITYLIMLYIPESAMHTSYAIFNSLYLLIIPELDEINPPSWKYTIPLRPLLYFPSKIIPFISRPVDQSFYIFPFWQFRIIGQFSNDSGSYTTSGLTVRHIPSGEQRTVWHLQYNHWPDKGVPDDIHSFLSKSLTNSVRKSMESS